MAKLTSDEELFLKAVKADPNTYIEINRKKYLALDVVSACIRNKGFNINACGADGNTALHIAARNKQMTYVDLLLSRDDIRTNSENNSTNKKSYTPAQLAQKAGSKEICDKINARTNELNETMKIMGAENRYGNRRYNLGKDSNGR